MKFYTKTIRMVLPVLITFLFTPCIMAQDPNEPIKVETNLVLINVLVRDGAGEFVRGLDASQFEVFDNNSRQQIESFSAQEAPISFGIVYDMHPTTAERTRAVIESLRRFKSGLGPDDDIFVVAFNMQGLQVFDFVPELDQLDKFMADPGRKDMRSLYDAVYYASGKIQASRNRKRVLLILSDSADHNSKHKLSEVRTRLDDLKAEVYAVMWDQGDDMHYADVTHQGRETYPFSRDATALDRAALRDLARDSGGGTFVGSSPGATQLFNIYKQIDREMRAHYTLGFYPETIDTKPHGITVRLRRVPGSKHYSLTYRTRYVGRSGVYE